MVRTKSFLKWIAADGKPKRNDQVTTSSSRNILSNVVLTVCAEAVLDETRSDEWFVDNGATKHVTYQCDIFVSFEEFDIPHTVTAVGEESLPALGKVIVISYGTWLSPVAGIRPPPPVCLDTNCAENWRYFKQKWLNYAVITNLANQSRQYQVALLLHAMGDQALKIYNGFNFATTEDNRSVDKILAKFD